MPLYYSTSISLDNYNIDDYVFADDTVKQKLVSIAQERMKNIDSLIVLSTEGNGGTMLLLSTLKLMVEDESQHIRFGGDHYSELVQMPVDEFIQLCEPYRYIVFDNLERGCSFPNQYQWLETAFRMLSSLGKKTLATYTIMEEVDLKVPDFIHSSAHEVVYSLSEITTYPEIVRRFFEREKYAYVTEELVHQISSTKDANVRMLEGLCIYHLAKEHLAGKI
jgi:hypothetical protein